MTADIVNLRRARKAKTRAEKAREAERNRIAHGRAKAERRAAEAEASRAERVHEGHRRDAEGGEDGGPT